MKMLLHLGMVLLLILSGGAAAKPPGARAAADVIRVATDWIAAAEAGHRDEIDRIVHPEFLGVSVGGHVRRKRDVLDAMPPPVGSSQVLVDVTVRVFDDAAVMHGINRYRAAPTARPIDVLFTDVYVRVGRRWQVVSSYETLRSR